MEAPTPIKPEKYPTATAAVRSFLAKWSDEGSFASWGITLSVIETSQVDVDDGRPYLELRAQAKPPGATRPGMESPFVAKGIRAQQTVDLINAKNGSFQATMKGLVEELRGQLVLAILGEGTRYQNSPEAEVTYPFSIAAQSKAALAGSEQLLEAAKGEMSRRERRIQGRGKVLILPRNPNARLVGPDGKSIT